MDSNPSPIRILLADDHLLVRAGIRSLVEKLPGLRVVAEAADGLTALALVREHRPDVVLMDIGMPGLNGVEATARITAEFPAVRVIILSMHRHEEYVLQSIKAGACGYLLKHSAEDRLADAIAAVTRGETYLCPMIAGKLEQDRLKPDTDRPPSLELLTERQRTILQLIAEGKTTKEAAFLLNLSAKTIEFHRAQLMDRLHIRDVPGLVRFAIRTGLIPLDSSGTD